MWDVASFCRYLASTLSSQKATWLPHSSRVFTLLSTEFLNMGRCLQLPEPLSLHDWVKVHHLHPRSTQRLQKS